MRRRVWPEYRHCIHYFVLNSVVSQTCPESHAMSRARPHPTSYPASVVLTGGDTCLAPPARAACVGSPVLTAHYMARPTIAKSSSSTKPPKISSACAPLAICASSSSVQAPPSPLPTARNESSRSVSGYCTIIAARSRT